MSLIKTDLQFHVPVLLLNRPSASSGTAVAFKVYSKQRQMSAIPTVSSKTGQNLSRFLKHPDTGCVPCERFAAVRR